MKPLKRCILCNRRIWWWQQTREGSHITCGIESLKEWLKEYIKEGNT